MNAGLWPLLAAAAALGLAGSVHCLAMCGGIAAAAGTRLGSEALASTALLAGCTFNLGRLASYAALGALAGALAGAFAGTLPAATAAAGLRVAAAALMAALGLGLLWQRDLLRLERLGARLWGRLQPLTSAALALPLPLRLAALGALWGFLPCGLVYSAVALAAASGSAAAGASALLAFGIGTLPSMLVATFAGAGLVRRIAGARTRRAAGILMLLCAAWTAAGPLPHLSGEHRAPASAVHQHG